MLTKGIEECRCIRLLESLVCMIRSDVLYERRKSICLLLFDTVCCTVAPSALKMVNSGQGEFECAICHRQYAARKLWSATVAVLFRCFNMLIESHRVIIYEAHKAVP